MTTVNFGMRPSYPDSVNSAGTVSDDTINGDTGADTLQGDAGNDSIYGDFGEDTLSGDEGFDFVDTGYGSDVVLWNLGDQHDFVQGLYFTNEQKILRLGLGITPDMVSFQKGDASATDFITSQLSAWTTSTSGRDLRVIITHPSDSSLSGSIIIDDWDNYRDYWLIELLEDGTRYQGNYLTTQGDDTISGTNAEDSYQGSGGNDTLNGNSGDDSLFGEQGDDTLNGNNGDDSLHGGMDNDLVYGSSGNDAYYWSFGDGHDYFSDSQGINTLVLGTGITEELWQVEKGDNVNASNYISGWSANLDGTDLRISITHPTDSALSGSIVIESWTSYADHWQIQFPEGYIILGTLLGTDGYDTLTGSAESDIVYGGLEKDYCRAYGGDDIYVYHLNDGFDVWEDRQGLNTIRFGENITPEMLTFRLYDITTTSVSEIPFLPPENLEDLGIVIESNGVQVGFIVISNWIYNTMNWRVEFTATDSDTGLIYSSIERTIIRDQLLPWDADLDNDTIPDWWEILVAGGLTTLTDTSDPDGDSLSALDEYRLGSDPLRWEGLQQVTVTSSMIDVSDVDNRSLELSLVANESHNVEIILYGFNFDVDGQFNFTSRTGGDFGDFNFTEIATISQVLSAGDNTVNWDGIDAATDQFHGYEVIATKITSTETDGGGNADVIDSVSDYIEEGGILGLSDSYPDNFNRSDEFFRNGRMRFSFGSNEMKPVIAHHQIYPGIWNNRLLYRSETVDWLPFTTEGRLVYEQARLGNLVLPESSQSYFKTRSLPENSIIYTNQNIEFTNYAVEAYRSIPSLGEVLNGVFTLSGDAKVTLQLYRPDLTPYPLYYYNEATQNYELLQDLPLGAGDHMLEFVAMNFESFESNGNVTLFDDSNMSSPVSGLDGYFRVKFIIEDARTGKVTIYWASVLVTN